mmetsp:Transcript_8223/g.16382  ORF Transcript_8223/g.16382 Transcript_8223/m.16382 type:complete len:226 (-) Transcript_8223:1004-1681(-)
MASQQLANAVTDLERALGDLEAAHRAKDLQRCRQLMRNVNQSAGLAKQTLRRNEVALNSNQSADPNALHAQCEKAREKIENVQARAMSVKADLERQELFGASRGLDEGSFGAAAASRSSGQTEHNILQASMKSVTNSAGMLQDTQRSLHDTEEIGISTLNELDGQRETLLRATDKVNDTNSAAGQAKRALRRMARRTCYNRALLWSIIVLLVILIIIFIFLKFIK